MAIDSILVGFGCPRAGTTFLEACLRSIPGETFAFKMNEHVSFHPCQSATGLLEFERAFHAHRCTFVRIVRDPLEIARSFVFARRKGTRNLAGIGRNSDERVVAWITSESENVRRQETETLHGRTSGRLRIVTIRYESLADLATRAAVADHVADAARLTNRQRNALFVGLGDFGRRPKRAGRLSHGFDGDPFTEEELAYFTRELAEVRRREGYV